MIVQMLIEKAMLKAQAVQATMLTQETSSVDFENDRLKSAESSQRTQIDLKVVVNGKMGLSSTTDPGDIDGVVSRALEAAAFGSPVHFELPEPGSLEPVKIFDAQLLQLAKPEMIHIGQQMMDMIKAYNPEILAGAASIRIFINLNMPIPEAPAILLSIPILILGRRDSWCAGPISCSQGTVWGRKNVRWIRKRSLRVP